MRCGIVLFMAFSLVGCKSLEYVRSLEPVEVGETQKPVEAFVECLSLKWSSSGGHLSVLPLADGLSIGDQHPMGGFDAVLDAKRISTGGSHYELFERVPMLTSGKYKQSLADCR